MSGLRVYDSTDATLIPADADAVLGYGDGLYVWSPAWWDLFPKAAHLVIVVSAVHAGDILDIETGDALPSDAPGWCQRFDRPARRAPSLYCNRVTWPLVVRALGWTVASSVDWCIATLDGTTNLWFGAEGVPVPAGLRVVGIQVLDVGGNYDAWSNVDPAWVLGGFSMQVGLDPGDPVVAELMVKVRALHGQWATVSGSSDPGQWTALDRVLDMWNKVTALYQQGVPPAELQPLVDSLTALSKHLGIGVP